MPGGAISDKVPRVNTALNSVAAPDRSITRLNQSLADQIAAGEVVERPASVVKELVENAIDAGATRVDVELVDGGLTSIRVIDNGRGIRGEELELALLRHATSKVVRPEDLVEIHSLGFRGEALASIAAVAHVTLRSRRAGDEVGHELRSLPGTDLQKIPVGMPFGTQVEVRSLFACVPARRKFMRSEATEVGHCSEALIRIALVHPEVHITLKHGRRELLNFRPADPGKRVEQVLMRRGSGPFFQLAGSSEGVEVSAWLGHPKAAIRGRSGIVLVVRRRVVRERSLAQIVSQAYGDLLPSGHYPVACLMVEPPVGDVDVNVHPQKAEVRFQRPQQVYAAVRSVLLQQVQGAPWNPAQPAATAWHAPREPAVPLRAEIPELDAHQPEEVGRSRDDVASAPAGTGDVVSEPAASRSPEVSPDVAVEAKVGARKSPARSRRGDGDVPVPARLDQEQHAPVPRDDQPEEEHAAVPSRDDQPAEEHAAVPSRDDQPAEEHVPELEPESVEAGDSDEQVADTQDPPPRRRGPYKLTTRALDGDYSDHKKAVMNVVAWMKDAKAENDGNTSQGPGRSPSSVPNTVGQGHQPTLLPTAAATESAATPPATDFAARVDAAESVYTNNSELRASDGRAIPQLVNCLPGPVAVFAEPDAILAVDLRRLRSWLVFQRLTREISWRREVGVQRLLSPAIVRRPKDEIRLCVAAREQLLTLGIDLDAFGDDALVVRGVPAHLRNCIDDADVADLVDRVIPWLRLRARENNNTEDRVTLLTAIAETRGGDPAPRLARRWIAEAYELTEDISSVPGVVRWTAVELLKQVPKASSVSRSNVG